jgi:hypothetical protein
MAILLISMRRRKLNRVGGTGESAWPIATYEPSNPKLGRADQVAEFFAHRAESKSDNLYLAEMLADHLEFRLIGKTDLPPPEFLARLAAAALEQTAKAQ